MRGPIRVIQYRTWAELRRDLFQELYDEGIFQPERYLFRGVGSADWQLVASFDRIFGQVPPQERAAVHERLLERWLRDCQDAGVSESITGDETRLWALGQHHGLPTRLLDWSTSPYVAAFFAFQDLLTGPGPFTGAVALWVLHAEHPLWREAGVDVVRAPAVDSRRHRSQASRFTLIRAPFGSLEEYVECFAGAQPALTKCVLPADQAGTALSDLEAMGINSHELFPDLSGLARATTMRARLGLHGPAGY